jgi:hypothetical protein
MTPEELERLAELSADVVADEDVAEWRALLKQTARHREPEPSDYDAASGHTIPQRLACLRAEYPDEEWPD